MLRVVGQCGGALALIAKSAVVLVARSIAPAAWPILRVIGLSGVPQLRRHLPPQARVFASQIGTPILFLMLFEKYLKHRRVGAHRTMQLWQRMLPIYAAYVWTHRRIRLKEEREGLTQEQVEALWEERHEWGADKVYAMVLEASGYVVKVAQIIASKPDVIPEQWTAKLSNLFDSMPPKPWKEVQLVLDNEAKACPIGQALLKGKNGGVVEISDVFESVNEESLASASVAQVHAATVSESSAEMLGDGWNAGDRVVLKVQHNLVKGLMHIDLNNADAMAKFCKNVLPFEIDAILQEMRQAVPLEFDFVREGRLSQAIKARLNSAEFRQLHVPRAAMDLCTPKMLVLEYMEGRPFSKLLPEAAQDPDLLKSMQRGMEIVMKAYGKMIIHDGLFHGDPHPGNILLRPDGQLVLLDFGQCKALPFERHMGLARLIVAMNRGDTLPIVLAMSELGVNFKGKRGEEPTAEAVMKMAVMMFDTRYLPEALVNPFGGSEEHLLSSMAFDDFPPDLWLVVRVMMILRGVCHNLGLDINTSKLWLPYAREVLKNPEAARLRSVENRKLDVGELDVVESSSSTQISGVDVDSFLDDLWYKN